MKQEKTGKAASASQGGSERAQADKAKPAVDITGHGQYVMPADFLLRENPQAGAPRASRSGGALPPELEALAGELGAKLELVQQDGAARALNISFDSKTLEGLQVLLQRASGEVNIQFMTNSPALARVLRQHAGELRETLAQKGVKVRGLGVAGPGTRISDRYSNG